MTIKRLIPILALPVFGCTGPSPSSPNDQRMGRVVAEGRGADYGSDDFVVNGAAVAGDTLSVSMSYGGGCRTHAMTLVTSASFTEGDPVRLEGVFRHEANGDPCERWVTETWLFDLAPIRERHRDVYGPGAGVVLLRIEGVPARLVYEFD